MLTIQRNRSDEKRKSAYSSAPVQEYKTLDEDYQDTLISRENQREDELWNRLSQTAAPTESHNNYTSENRDYTDGFRRETRRYNRYESSAYQREKSVEDLPMYQACAPSTSMAVKKYNIGSHSKKKNNTVGKMILVGYIAVISLITTLVIVDSTMKISSAAVVTPENESQIEYVEHNTNESSNWFDRVCDWFSNIAGD